MNADLLIDAIIHQTVVLIAQLATAAGSRAGLTHLADELFVELSRELKGQGVSNKVIADMFGMLLRSYHKKMRRLAEAQGSGRSTTWRAILEHAYERAPIRQAELLHRFRYEDEEIVRGILKDLCDSGILARRGRGASAIYALAEAHPGAGDGGQEALAALAWVHIYHQGPIDLPSLAAALKVAPERLEEALDALVEAGRVERLEGAAGAQYTCQEYNIALDHPAGWEAAVFDHFQAMVTTITGRLARLSDPRATRAVEGGSTYAFDLWTGHPHEAQVLSLYEEIVRRTSALRAEIEAHNAGATPPEGGAYRVLFYAGQRVLEEEEG